MLENRKLCLNLAAVCLQEIQEPLSLHWPQKVNNSYYMVAGLVKKSMGQCEATNMPRLPKGATSVMFVRYN